MTETEIIAGLKKGDQRSYELLYDKFYRRIRFFADQYVNDLEVAHELTVDAFIKLWEKREDFDTVYNVKAFLFITVRNASLNHLRIQKRRKQAHEEMLYTAEANSDYVMAKAIMVDIVSHIFRESGSLTNKSRQIFHLRYIEGLSYQEIAHRLHISVDNVRVQHANALNTLRILLKRKGLLLLALIFALLLM
jgi:RNA polymerase sigma factor, sigma-70 family